ncbi:MAG: cell division protein FtsL [Pseudomonadota bacterium]
MQGRRSLVGGLALLGIALLSAFSVVASTHESRQIYSRLQGLEADRWYLEEEHSRLLLEQSTWASHHRIESEALNSLKLVVPAGNKVRVVSLGRVPQ